MQAGLALQIGSKPHFMHKPNRRLRMLKYMLEVDLFNNITWEVKISTCILKRGLDNKRIQIP